MTTFYRQNPRCASRIFQGEAAVITPGNQRISILNPIATEVWELCENQPRTSEEICTTMRERYETSEETIETDVQELLDHLVELDALKPFDGDVPV